MPVVQQATSCGNTNEDAGATSIKMVASIVGEDKMVVMVTVESENYSLIPMNPSQGLADEIVEMNEEQESWSLIEGLSWDYILFRSSSTVTGIKDHLKVLWQQAMRIPICALSVNIRSAGAWKLLCMLPSMLLARDAQRGGKKGGGEMKRKFKCFLAYQRKTL